jgi:hypothetical protein
VYKTGALLPENVKYPMNTTKQEWVLPADAKPERVVLDPRTVLLASWEFEEEK